ncbi:S8 family serine peptidase, partial [PVC group bacterium]|nr:S8 family serine peptidase [PVC group bacterium]
MQFHDIPNDNERRFLKEAKTKLLHYLPHKAWFASLPRAITENALMNSNVRWIGLILPEDKIFSTLLSQGVSSRNTRPDGSVNLEVSFFKDVSLGVARNLIGRMGGVITKELNIFHRFTIQISSDRIMDLANEDIVRWIMEKRPPPILHNDGSRANIGVDPLHEAPYNLSGAGVNVGIWDGGDVDSNHDDFGARVTLVENVGVIDHATHVAGTMGGDGSRSLAEGGTALQWKGIAPGIDIISHDFFDNLVEHDNAINVLGIDLSQNSWGFNLLGPPPSPQFYGAYTLDAPEYDDIITGLYGKRITVVFSAGNDRNDVAGDFDTIGPPGTGKNIITVGAINSDDDSMTVFSGFGPMDDGRIKPDVVAPGDEVGGDLAIKSTFPNDTYGLFVGTSMAAPVVSGSAALIIEDFRNIFPGLDPLPSTVKALLIHEAKDLGNIGPDYSFGFGGIQIRDSIDKLRAESLVEDEVGHQVTDLYNLNVPAGTTEVKISLVWDDEPAVDAAAITLVNDLDLIVTDPNSVRHFPWTLDPANPANPAVKTAEDRVNIAEQVSVTSGIISGNWTIEVFGFNVPVAPQKYSLIFTPNFGANVSGKIYFDSSFTKEETFFDLTELVFIEAFVTSLGVPLTGATVAAELKLVSDGSLVANIGLVDVGGGFYRNSWNSTGEAPGVYLLDINVTNPVVVNTREKFHIYPLSGVSAYRFDFDEDGIEDFVLENRHLISVYDGRVNTDRSLLILRQKDTQANYQFGDISDSDVIGRGEVTTSNLKGIKFHSFDFSDSGENKTSVNLNMITEVSDPTEELITFYDLTNGASNDARVFVDNGQWLAQRFNQTDLDEDFTLSRVSVFVDSGPRASNPLIVEIRTDNGGFPSST